MTRAALAEGVVAEIAGHAPQDKPPHAHILVAARYAGRRRYGKTCPDLDQRLKERLGAAWLNWLGSG